MGEASCLRVTDPAEDSRKRQRPPRALSSRARRVSAAGCCPRSGTRRSSAPPGGPRGSPRRPATGRGACRRRRRPCRARCGSRGRRRRRCRAGRARRRASSRRPALQRAGKADGEEDEVGPDDEFAAGDRAALLVDAGALDAGDAALARPRCRASPPGTRARRPRPGSTRCASWSASRARSASLSSCSGGVGRMSSCVTESAPCRKAVPMQSEAVSPPPMTTTCLPAARIGVARRPSSPPTRRFCCVR